MDGVEAERRRPSSCQSSFNFLTAAAQLRSPSGDVAAVAQRQTSTVGGTDAHPSTSTTSADVHAGETDDAHVDDSVLDLSTTPDRRLASSPPVYVSVRKCGPGPPPVKVADSSAPVSGRWDVYQRHVDDLQRLDELIRQRTYERNVLSWRRDQTKRSLDRLFHPVHSTVVIVDTVVI